jgi:guanylate kinase
VDGGDYRFVDVETFRRLVEDGAFLEWAEVFGHRYGTLIGPIARDLEEGRDVVLEIDIQGARTVRERMPHAVLIFLVPPSIEELVRRLRGRATESEADLARRMAAVADELAQAEWFDHVVVNDDVGRATSQVAAIIGGDPRKLRKEQDPT